MIFPLNKIISRLLSKKINRHSHESLNDRISTYPCAAIAHISGFFISPNADGGLNFMKCLSFSYNKTESKHKYSTIIFPHSGTENLKKSRPKKTS